MTETFAGKRVLVTGATGLIGSHLAVALLAQNADVHAFIPPEEERESYLTASNEFHRVQVHGGRLEVEAEVRSAVIGAQPQVVFHLGAQTQVGAARVDPRYTYEVNVAGSWNVLDACRQLAAPPLAIAIASSDKAYGRSEKLPYLETDPLAGTEPYELSKSMTDLLAQSYAATYGLRIRIARCGNVYGAGDSNWERIVPGTIRSLLRGERPQIRSDGTPVRDYVHVADAVDAYLRLASLSIAPGTAFNFSSGERLRVLDVVQLITDAMGSSLPPEIQGGAAGELAEQYLDSTKARRELGWQPRHRLKESLPEIVDWYRSR